MVSVGNLKTQNEYLHSERWPKVAVDKLVEQIATESAHGDWDYPNKMANGILNAKLRFGREDGIHYYYEEIFMALEMLNERWVVWSKLANHPGVIINKFTNVPEAHPSVWMILLQEDERVKWYANEGEEHVKDLELIFKNPWKGKESYVTLGWLARLEKATATVE